MRKEKEGRPDRCECCLLVTDAFRLPDLDTAPKQTRAPFPRKLKRLSEAGVLLEDGERVDEVRPRGSLARADLSGSVALSEDDVAVLDNRALVPVRREVPLRKSKRGVSKERPSRRRRADSDAP